MPTALKETNKLINIKQYITDGEGHKIAVIIDIKELQKIKKLLKNIPTSETWLYENEEALKSIQKGLKEASEGKISKLNIDEL
ncbi:MAG TPA: hypothetical protein ACFYEK_13745 [Candidatus Wunengus sp. YC60]|uniref:hypothetical protein n=1 Tax=Candidatus Wunengus sp. YC60 TaxID=3367697 RepID=UPI004024D56E